MINLSQIYSIMYSLQQIVVTNKLQNYSKLDSLKQIVATLLQVTDQSVSYYTFSLLTVCF